MALRPVLRPIYCRLTMQHVAKWQVDFHYTKLLENPNKKESVMTEIGLSSSMIFRAVFTMEQRLGFEKAWNENYFAQPFLSAATYSPMFESSI